MAYTFALKNEELDPRARLSNGSAILRCHYLTSAFLWALDFAPTQKDSVGLTNLLVDCSNDTLFRCTDIWRSVPASKP